MRAAAACSLALFSHQQPRHAGAQRCLAGLQRHADPRARLCFLAVASQLHDAVERVPELAERVGKIAALAGGAIREREFPFARQRVFKIRRGCGGIAAATRSEDRGPSLAVSSSMSRIASRRAGSGRSECGAAAANRCGCGRSSRSAALADSEVEGSYSPRKRRRQEASPQGPPEAEMWAMIGTKGGLEIVRYLRGSSQ